MAVRAPALSPTIRDTATLCTTPPPLGWSRTASGWLRWRFPPLGAFTLWLWLSEADTAARRPLNPVSSDVVLSCKCPPNRDGVMFCSATCFRRRSSTSCFLAPLFREALRLTILAAWLVASTVARSNSAASASFRHARIRCYRTRCSHHRITRFGLTHCLSRINAAMAAFWDAATLGGR